MIKKESAITLIALIITIIILVILAAVSVRAVYNMGIVNHAVNGTEGYAKAAKEENEILQGTKDFLESTVSKIKSIENNTISKGQKAVGGNKEYKSGNYTAIIPEDWVVSGKTTNNDETTISTGLVIYYINDMTEEEIAAIDWTDSTVTENLRRTYDQFVWIPMPKVNINKMFMCQSEDGTNSCRITLDENGNPYCTTHSSNLMAGRLYATEAGENFNASLTSQTYNVNSGLREPAIITGNNMGNGTGYDAKITNLNQISEILGARTDLNELYDSADHFKTTLQNEYNKIVASIYTNEGFWVGRYETSGMTDTNTAGTIKVIAGASDISGKNPNISNVSWYRMYAQQKKYAEGKNMLGGMIQGATHDQTLLFADTDINYSITTKGYVAHGLGTSYETGNTSYPNTATVQYNDIANNIYDLEGNLFEWTTEANGFYIRMYKGGAFSYDNSASYRWSISLSYYPYSGSRMALYIK